MKNFKSDSRSRDRKDFSKRDFADRDSRRPTMHDAVCDECGKDCQVPFKPSGEKPVYCSDCFEKKGGRSSNRPSWGGSGKRSFNDRDRDRGRSSQSNISDRSTSQLIEKIEILNTNLGKIINLLSSSGEKKSELVEGRTKKNKNSKNTKADKNNDALTLVEKKDTDSTVDNTLENIKSKPKKRARKKVNPSVKNKV